MLTTLIAKDVFVSVWACTCKVLDNVEHHAHQITMHASSLRSLMGEQTNKYNFEDKEAASAHALHVRCQGNVSHGLHTLQLVVY